MKISIKTMVAALLLSIIDKQFAVAHQVRRSRPFKIGESEIDFDEVPELPDPITYSTEMVEDENILAEAKKELTSAQKNAELGSINREMSSMLVQDIKNKFSELDEHFTRQIAPDNGEF